MLSPLEPCHKCFSAQPQPQPLAKSECNSSRITGTIKSVGNNA
jgi:hypothetical protein